ncbi:hypothetical protein [Pelosinus baikalensis]|uniref:Uncharacterized protein n=1 Tax=Pelosinus baikalensis TaxID=2892015 RepID=A0ABS8HVH3_9FIRM|nr:hypothetical protein [Pelosinus baikalensis]MCC5466268.1 hypothetical protein [Pelosinus baikalensis]
MNTQNDNLLGSEGLAAQLGGKKSNYRNGIQYKLEPEADNSWLVDIHPAPGLTLTRAYFKPIETITRIYTFPDNCLWLCSFDSGNLIITEKGKKGPAATARHASYCSSGPACQGNLYCS